MSNSSNLQVQTSYKQIFKIMLPICIAIVIPQLNFFINSIFLAHYDSETVLGIAGITGVYYLMFSSIGSGLNNGLQSLISRRAGENNPAAIGRYYAHGVWIAMGLAAVGILFTYLALPFIFKLFITDQKLIVMAMSFLRIRILGLPFLYFFQMRNALMVGTNNSKYLPIGTAAETLVNIILDYCLIFGKWGCPELGFNGAAYASIATEVVGMIVTYFIIVKSGIKERFSVAIKFDFSKEVLSSIWTQSGPLMFQHAISIGVWLFYFLLLGQTVNSSTNLAISNTMRNIFGLFGVTTWALGSTTNTMVSNVIGQGRSADLPKVFRKLIISAVACSSIIALVLLIFPGTFFSVFSDKPNLVSAAIPTIRVVAVALVLLSISMICLSTVIGAGFTKFSLMAEIGSTFCYCIFSWYFTSKQFIGLHVAWTNEWVYWGFIFVLCFWIIRAKVFSGKLNVR